MTARRKHIPDRVKLAACLLEIFAVSHERAKAMSVDEILALAQWDHHPISYADGGPDEPWNLCPMSALQHRTKTAIDAGIRAKTKRISAAHAAHATHAAKMATKLDPPPSSPRITRPLFKDMKRKIRSRGFAKVKGSRVTPTIEQ